MLTFYGRLAPADRSTRPKPAPGIARYRGTPRTTVARFYRCRHGTAVVEFAFAAPVFLLLVCMILEMGLALFTQANLDNATRDAARLILTGQVQTGGGSAAFQNRLCADLGTLIPCASVQYNVQAASSFGALNATVQTNGSGGMANPQFSPGGPGQDVLVQVAYLETGLVSWFTPLLNGHGSWLLMSTVAFQSEPYQ